MYNPGGDYLTYIKDSIIRKPRSKIVVDGKTYTGLEHLVSFPKITHETEKMIGGFPAKTCEFEIYNLDGKLSLNGKEVQVYRGLDISDTKTVWIPMGLFYADGEDVTNNSTKRTIQFKGTDRTRLFDSPFANVYSNGIIPADTVISTVAEKICAKHGLTINAATKANIISYRFTEAVGTPENTTDRQVIAWIAELSGCIPIISRDGQSLMFTRPSYKSTVTESGKTYPSGSYADKRKYKTLSAEPLYGPINAVSFGHADYDDAYVYQDDTDVQANGLHEWQINDNPLVENYKAALATKVFAIIKGMKLYPFELTEFIDDYLFDLNDGILIKKKDGTFVTTYVLGMNTTSRIRSTFKAGTQDSSTADRNLAGSVKSDLKKVKLSVDHINNQITALVKETDEKYSKLTQTVDGFETEIVNTKNGLEAKITATAEKAELTYAKQETVNGQIEGVTNQIEAMNTELSGLDGKIEGKVTTEVQKDTTISILAGKVESKISGNYVTKATYDDEKKNWLLKTTYDSYVKQTDQQISAAVSRVQKLEDAEYITKTQCSSLISAQADKIALTVESNLKYESRNLLMDSECFEHLTPSGYHATYVSDYVATGQSYLSSGKARQLKFKAESAEAGIKFSAADTVGGKDKIKPKTTYTLSFWARLYNDNDNAPQNLYWQESVYTATSPNGTVYDNNRTRGLEINGSWHKVVIVFTTPENVSDFQLRFALTGCVTNQLYTIVISSLKLEIGNVATEWATRTPSAEEVEEYAKSEIAQLPDRITLSVEKNLKIGARNILLDSACFKSFTPSGFYATVGKGMSFSDSAVPSGYRNQIAFTPTQNGACGFQFNSSDIIGETSGSINRIKPSTTYTLSFWLKSFAHAGMALNLDRLIWCGDGNSPTIDSQRCKVPAIPSDWEKYVIVFKTPATVSEFRLRFILLDCSTKDESIDLYISSLKLEEGTIATDWTPSTDDLEKSVDNLDQYVKAQIDMCVQKDENNNLVSEINIASNKLAINTDNFTLAKDGTMTCTGAKIVNGSIKCGEGDTSMEILNGLILHKELNQHIGAIGTTIDRNGKLAETIMGTNSVSIVSGHSIGATGGSGAVAFFDFLPDGTLKNGQGWNSPYANGTETFSGFKHFRLFKDTNGEASNILMVSAGVHGDQRLGLELYDTKNGQVECAIKIKRNDNAVVSIYGVRGRSESPALTLGGSDGYLYYNGKKLAFAT